MTMQTVSDLCTPIGDVLDLAGDSGVLVQGQGKAPFAVIKLDDDLLDFLIERNPRFIAECNSIRQKMQSGASHRQAAIDEMFSRKRLPPS